MKNICIVAGEPNSINSEIIAKSWLKLKIADRKKLIIIGNYNLIKLQLKKLKYKIDLEKTNIFNQTIKNKLRIYDISLKKNKLSKYIKDSLNKAHELAIKGKIKGFINCAIDKSNLPNQNGVTEYLSSKNKNYFFKNMLIYNEKVSVVPLTTHVELKKVSNKLSKKFIIKKINDLEITYRKLFKKKAKIAILGLNPHNNEYKKNSEEVTKIIPAINKLKKKINIKGPFSADSFFSKPNFNKYDIIVGMYHDQVLTPFKTIFNFNAINITLGLNYIRISPDHGTGKDIVGKKIASSLSLIKSIKFFLKYC